MAATTKGATVNKDVANKKITVTREFDGPVEKVWKAWTQEDLLDKWWAPKPWKAETKSMDFREGGSWVYAMVGPDGEKHFARIDYKKVVPNKSFLAEDYFADENGKRTDSLPGMDWDVTFAASGSGTKVTVAITFASEEDLNKILEMGFEQGFLAALNNLDELV